MEKQNYDWQVTFDFLKSKNHVVLIVIALTFIINISFAQLYSFSEIKENFFQERPQTGDLVLRENSFGSVDDLILGTFPPLHPDTKVFYASMLEKAILEIQIEQVTEGATIWQLYNHGFVIKTPSKCFGFDLYDYFNIPEFMDLAELIDVYFISHQHGDHYEHLLIKAVKSLDKPVVGPAEFASVTVKMNAGDSTVISDLKVIAHYGMHSVPVRQFEVKTPEGLIFLHTGDNQTSLTLPVIADVDVLLLNAWINESGATSYIEGIRKAIKKVKPRVTLPGHILELGHLGSAHTPVTYLNVLKADDGELTSKYYVLEWGERYHYDNRSNDSIRPYPVQNLIATIQDDSILVSWDIPQVSEDGDTASFYRIFQDDLEDMIITEKQYKCEFDTIRTFNFKIYSYDDCGNQSEDCAKLQFIPPTDVIYPFITSATDFELFQNYPNPFNPTTSLEFTLPKSEYVELKVYNIHGKEVATLASKNLNQGNHKYQFDGGSLSSGIYFYRIEAGKFQDVKKMVFVK